MPETQLNCPQELGAGDDQGKRPVCSHTPHPQVQRAAQHGKAGMQEGPLLLSFFYNFYGKRFFDHGPCLGFGSKSAFLFLPSASQFPTGQ